MMSSVRRHVWVLLLLQLLLMLKLELQNLLLLLVAQRVIVWLLHIRRVKFLIVTGGVTSVKVICI